MNYLWLLTESDNDQIIYESLATKLTGLAFEEVETRLSSRSGGSAAIRKGLRYFVNDIKRTGPMEGSFFLIATDNDRQEGCRDHILGRLLELVGPREDWPIPGALAVPIEMIESWVLLTIYSDKCTEDLPKFSLATCPLAKAAYNGDPPPQLKDLIREEMAKAETSDYHGFMLDALEQLDPESLTQRSESFNLFMEDLATWSS